MFNFVISEKCLNVIRLDYLNCKAVIKLVFIAILMFSTECCLGGTRFLGVGNFAE